ncbi:Maf family protein [Brevibacterium renqingii]|uniref:Maf family protein n=1 Tax=Brevibacterium renqingii TaxID=2776916 RepID=UPI001AE0B74B|nr:nucleoside triphosphate pyrophosphatase [Brevibacterium renqingii]
MIPVVLASQSPARRQILTGAGIDPIIIVSEVDERAIEAGFTGTVADLTTSLSAAKARAVIERIVADPPPDIPDNDSLVVIAGDSLLEFEGRAIGKPESAERTRSVWSEIAGRWTQLHTGHTVALLTQAPDRVNGGDTSLELRAIRSRRSTTSVLIGSPSPNELEAYIATEEPFQVAGALTIDGFGGAFVDRLDGDHLTVLGLSLPVVRALVTDMGLFWPDLWSRAD